MKSLLPIDYESVEFYKEVTFTSDFGSVEEGEYFPAVEINIDEAKVRCYNQYARITDIIEFELRVK